MLEGFLLMWFMASVLLCLQNLGGLTSFSGSVMPVVINNSQMLLGKVAQ